MLLPFLMIVSLSRLRVCDSFIDVLAAAHGCFVEGVPFCVSRAEDLCRA